MRRLFRWQEQKDRERQALQALQHSRALLGREIADLRRLKEVIAQEIVAMQRQEDTRSVNETAATDYDNIVQGEETHEEHRHQRVRADRRKAYSV